MLTLFHNHACYWAQLLLEAGQKEEARSSAVLAREAFRALGENRLLNKLEAFVDSLDTEHAS